MELCADQQVCANCLVLSEAETTGVQLGLGNTEDKVISTCPSGHSFPFAVCPCFGSIKRSQGFYGKQCQKHTPAVLLSAEQGHAKCYLLESEGDRKAK